MAAWKREERREETVSSKQYKNGETFSVSMAFAILFALFVRWGVFLVCVGAIWSMKEKLGVDIWIWVGDGGSVPAVAVWKVCCLGVDFGGKVN